MNAELEQWIYKNLPFMWENCIMSTKELIEYLKDKPHLLREDGENEEIKIQHPMTYAQSMAKKQMEGFPRPTDEQKMEQEAREMKDVALDTLKEIGYWAVLDGVKVYAEDDAITALTEFGKMWKERGREEVGELLRWQEAAIKEQELQLAEKDKKIEHALKCMGELQIESNTRLEQRNTYMVELTAAKAEIERLKNENGNLELALKNL